METSNSNTLYVLDQLSLKKSTDGGVAFSNVTIPAGVQEFAIDSTGTLYVGTFNMLYVSTDGGKTFALLPGLTSSNINLSTLGGKLYVGTTSPSVPFVVKLDPSGQNVLYSTFLGGSAGDGAEGLAVDSQGNAVLVGYATSPDFPLTVPSSNPPAPGKTDGFVAKLNPDGTHLIFSMALGGSKNAAAQAVALDSSGAVFITGQSYSADFPTTAKVFQAKIPSTPCPRPNNSLFGPFVNTGSYAFVTKISPDGSTLEYSTFLTGSCGSGSQGITVDTADDAIVVGSTTSPDFPVSEHTYQPAFPQATGQGIFDAGFVTKLDPAGDKVIASSYLGGGYSTQANAVALDAAGNAYITGFTQGFAPAPLGERTRPSWWTAARRQSLLVRRRLTRALEMRTF